jgi:glycosyltransferase involved in cell wall biosynthesis
MRTVAVEKERDEGGIRRSKGGSVVPLVSIIVVVFRDREELSQVLQSIIPYLSEQLEVVVIDGGSHDGTVELLRSMDNRIDYWLSEPDHGIYDAMNKGLKAATGEYIIHLNAGDRLRMIPWSELRRCSADKVDVVCCRVLIDDSIEYISRTGFLSRIDNTWHHQGTFYRKAAHLGYDLNYRAFGDFDHNQRLLLTEPSIINMNYVVAAHRNDGITSGESSREEIYRSISSNFGWPYLIPAMIRFRLLRLRSKLLGNKPCVSRKI